LVSYAGVAAARRAHTVPILGACVPTPSGLPASSRVVHARDWHPIGLTARTRQLNPHRVCLFVNDPVCQTLATYLAAATGRRVVGTSATDFDRTVEGLLDKVSSLTLFVPLWCADGLDPFWLARVLLLMRRFAHRTARLSWGVLTGATPDAASRLVAKAMLQPAIIAEYHKAPTCVVTTASRASVGSSLPSPGVDGMAPIQHVDLDDILAKRATRILNQRWSLMFFTGHGRSYCGSQGFLCGARRLEDAADAAITQCLLGMECASPADDAWAPGVPGFPRIDPRRYDTAFMVNDACGMGGWAFPSWDAGIPSVSFHGAAGAASAVITGDQVTMHQPGSLTDVLWALNTARTAGEATARLNHVRPEAAAALPYYLIGDPEVPCGPTRWHGWVVDAKLSSRTNGAIQVELGARTPGGAPFAAVRLQNEGVDDEPQTAHVSIDHDPGGAPPRIFRSWDRTDLWLEPGSGGRVTVEYEAATRFPPGMVAAAARVPATVAGWRRCLEAQGAALEDAARLVLQVAARLEQAAGRARRGRAADLRAAHDTAVERWIAAHRAAVERVVDLAPDGLWPFRLWQVGAFRNRDDETPCPYCGLAPTLLRRYDRFPDAVREQWECPRCVLLQDRPSAPAPSFAFRVGEVLTPVQPLTATVEIDNRGSDTVWLGYAAMLVDGRAHGTVASPTVLPVEVDSGGWTKVETTLALPARPQIHHRYWARSVLLLNATWFLGTRQIVVAA
jgi:hypothetical protein